MANRTSDMNAAAIQLRQHLRTSAQVTRHAAEECGHSILDAVSLIATAFRAGGKLLLSGNGGSAADCQHFAAEFTHRLSSDVSRPALPVIAITTDTAFITGYANDINFRGIFKRQVQALGKEGDVLVAISTSGNSENVLDAVEAARLSGIHTVGLTGTAGRLREIVDVAICIPSTNCQHIQESLLAIVHAICRLTEQQLYPEFFEQFGQHLICTTLHQNP